MEVVVSPKYQVLLPKEICEQADVKIEQKLHVIIKNGMITLVPDRPMQDLRGFCRGMGRSLPREEGERV